MVKEQQTQLNLVKSLDLFSTEDWHNYINVWPKDSIHLPPGLFRQAQPSPNKHTILKSLLFKDQWLMEKA